MEAYAQGEVRRRREEMRYLGEIAKTGYRKADTLWALYASAHCAPIAGRPTDAHMQPS